jgi:hypothetical protein
MKNKIHQITYFINVVVIQNSVLIVILGQDNPFVYPTMNVPLCNIHKL